MPSRLRPLLPPAAGAALAGLLAVTAAPAAASAATPLAVPGAFASVQAAIDAAAPGDTVTVGPGTYREHIDFEGKAITVVSAQGPASTVIDGGSTGRVVTFAHGEGRGSVLQGFTIRNGLTTSGDGGYGGAGIGTGLAGSGTGSGRSLIRVTASVSASAARSASAKYGASRQAATA